jgi:hypothetical protein
VRRVNSSTSDTRVGSATALLCGLCAPLCALCVEKPKPETNAGLSVGPPLTMPPDNHFNPVSLIDGLHRFVTTKRMVWTSPRTNLTLMRPRASPKDLLHCKA